MIIVIKYIADLHWKEIYHVVKSSFIDTHGGSIKRRELRKCIKASLAMLTAYILG
jgi:hypothetical protein